MPEHITINNSGCLSVSVNTLAGKTTAAFVDGPGLSPQIAFSDSKGSISPVWVSDNAEYTV